MPTLNRVQAFQPTPNPNALKCVLERPVAGPIRSYRDRSEAPTHTDPLARALFDLPGVVSLLISNDWITVNKTPEASWSALKPAIQQVLASCPAELSGQNP